MKLSYMIRYSCKSVLHKHDRIFSLLNIMSVAVTILILVSLSGLLKAFKDYSEKILNNFPLRIEIFKAENVLFNDLSEIENQIRELPGVANCFKRVPTAIPFLNAQGKELSYPPRGSTILPEESLELKDVHKKDVHFLSKEKINSRFDEVGIIVSFDFLKRLGYFPDSALANKPDTWEERRLPKVLYMVIKESGKENPKETRLPVPLVGVVANFRDEYIITEDFYDIIMRWRDDFRYMLKDRKGRPLMRPEIKITSAHYTLREEEAIWVDEHWGAEGRYLAILPEALAKIGNQKKIVWLDEHPELERKDDRLLKIQVFYQFWEDFSNDEQDEGAVEERLVINPVTLDKLTQKQINIVDRKLRTVKALANMGKLHMEQEKTAVQNWQAFPKIKYNHQYIQAAVYARDRKYILPLLEKLANMGVVASSPLKDYLKTFDRQEKFFVSAAIAIFVLILFLAAIVLFSTFYASVQRKRKQIGILKACGASRQLIRQLYYLESLVIIICGMAAGIAVGLRTGRAMTKWISKFVQLTENELVFSLPPIYIVSIVAVVSLFCWFAIFIPAQIAASTDPAQVVKN